MGFHLTALGRHLGYLEVVFQDTRRDFSLMLQCGLGELKGSRGVLAVFRVPRVSTAEQNWELQVPGRGLGGWVGRHTLQHREIVSSGGRGMAFCATVGTERGFHAPFSQRKAQIFSFSAKKKKNPLNDLEGEEVML